MENIQDRMEKTKTIENQEVAYCDAFHSQDFDVPFSENFANNPLTHHAQ